MANDTVSTPSPIVAQVLALLKAGPAALSGSHLFAELLLQSTDETSLSEIDARSLADEAKSAFAALRRKPPGSHTVTLRDATLAIAGSQVPVTVLEIVNDDRPFLLDSILGEVQAHGVTVRLVLHPIYKANRSRDGALNAVTTEGDRNWSDGRQESYVAVYLDPIPGEVRAALMDGISQVLDQVRVVVADWRPMVARVEAAIAELRGAAAATPGDLVAESLAFLEWLCAGNFTFLGVREYRLIGDPATGELAPIQGAGLGLLADPSVHVLRRGAELVAMTPEVRRFLFQPNPLIITKANVVARVHRRAHMDYIGIKRHAADGRLTGEVRVVGLFTSSAYTQSPRDIPLLRHKVARVVALHGAPPESHAGKALINVLETFPRDELFQIGVADLARWTAGILSLELIPRVRVFVRADRFDRFVSVLAFVPRDRFSTGVRERIAAYLAGVFDGYIAAFYPSFSDAPLVRVHFIVGRREGATPVIEERELERAIAGIVRTWDDRLADAFATATAGDGLPGLAAQFGQAFSAGYAERFSPDRAVEDAGRIDRLSPEYPVAIDFHRDPGAPESRIQAAIYRLGGPIRLSERVPVLENLGFSVIDERSYTIAPKGVDGVARGAVLHDMVLETADGRPLDIRQHETRLEDCFLAVLKGATESDAFNRLVVAAGLAWREAALVRAYATHLRQLGSAFGLRYIADTVVTHAGVVRVLVQLFHTRFDPVRGLDVAQRTEQETPIRAGIEEALAKVQSLDEDRILRQLLALVTATVRTNFYLRDANGAAAATIAFKYDGAKLDMAPQPRPYREIWVWSPRVEAVHLRFAPIARGGIRWSDRAQDFRTEILGLAKAQQVKNAVIVPAGAKGGFYPKQMPRGASREEVQKEGVETYKIFVSAMLDITDTLVDGRLVAPKDVVRHDDDDPYLVVAADKGTATFSDTANGLSTARGFWLADAFASGGSAGYDHKKLAITARGAWECVKRHFREMDRDIQTEPFRCAGVGDMSGDVFGNGMLLSPQTRLVAAFDHRDIFLDPDPDPAVSLAERRRVFNLSRSSWADYDRALISKGGGVYARSAKSIPLTGEVRTLLGVEATSMTPVELMHAILKAEVDLIYFGGIGTYVKASTETDLDVGDRGNDAIRVSAAELRAKVIGEGANLGMTQRARIEAAGRGLRLNTDFIDNSAGVNTSDQEVNIKIALGPVVADGRLSIADRNTLLVEMAGDVTAAVLRNNYQQSLALSLAERQGHAELGPNARLIRALEARRLLERRLEALPSDGQIAERDKAGRGFVRPELATLSSYSKIALLHDLLASKVPDDPYMQWLLVDYFPPALQKAFPDDLKRHRLRREIIATTLTNGLVNRLGAPTPLRLAEEASRPVADTAYAFIAAREVLGLADLWRSIDALDGHMRGTDQLALYERVREVAISSTSFFLRDGQAVADLSATVTTHKAGLAALIENRGAVLPGQVLVRHQVLEGDMTGVGAPLDLAQRIADLVVFADAPRITVLADASRARLVDAGRVWFEIGERFHAEALGSRGRQVRAGDDYDRLAIAGALDQLDVARRDLATAALAAGADAQGLTSFVDKHADLIARAERDLASAAGLGAVTLSRLSVGAGRLADLARDVVDVRLSKTASGERRR